MSSRLTLLMLASCALYSGSAAAQLNVNVEGFIDIGVSRQYDKDIQVGGMKSSNLIFSGKEDLGNSLYTVFQIGTSFGIDTGNTQDARNSPFWAEETTLGLESKLGTIKLGRALRTPLQNDWEYDPWGNNNRIASPTWRFWHAMATADPGANNGTDEFAYVSNAVFYSTPQHYDVSANVSMGIEKTHHATNSGQRYKGLSVQYKNKSIGILAAADRNGHKDYSNLLAVRYTLGNATVYGGYNYSKLAHTELNAKAMTLTARYNAGRFAYKLGVGNQKISNGEKNNFVGAGLDYALSQRTTLYGLGGFLKPDTGPSSNAYGVGLTHTF